jgi:hypothetical protein
MLCLGYGYGFCHIPVLQYQITQTQHQPNSHIPILQYQITQTQHHPNSHIPVLQYQITQKQHEPNSHRNMTIWRMLCLGYLIL